MVLSRAPSHHSSAEVEEIRCGPLKSEKSFIEWCETLVHRLETRFLLAGFLLLSRASPHVEFLTLIRTLAFLD